MHIDTGHNFPEVLEFRDRRVAELGVRSMVASVQEAIDARPWSRRSRTASAATGCRPRRCSTRSRSTGSTRCSAAPGATRRRPAPRSGCSPSATSSASGTRRTSAPSCGTSTTAGSTAGESIRVFPLSNWTELDIWHYIAREGIELPSIYFAHEREVFERDGMLLATSTCAPAAADDEDVFTERVRYRTVGDASCTGGRRARTPTLSTRSSPRSPPPGSPSAARPAATTGSARPPWKTASERGTSDDVRSIWRDPRPRDGRAPGRCCGSPPPARSTTASPRSSAGCCTTPSRSSRTSWRRWSGTSRGRGDEYTNLALLTDGLRAEREQGITIDVAYRYFATPRRKFIIADTPGHIQYTRNMVTGASTADLAIILVDARKGLVEQTRRHAFLASLLRVPHLVLAVNKMDLVDYDRGGLRARPATSSRAFATKLDVPDLTVIPMSALERRQRRRALGEHAVVPGLVAAAPPGERPRRVRPQPHRRALPGAVRDPAAVAPTYRDYRGYAGQVAGGVLKPGDEVMVLPSGFTSRDGLDRHLRRPGRAGLPADVGDDPARRRDRHLPRRHDLPRRTTSRASRRTSTRWSAGWTSVPLVARPQVRASSTRRGPRVRRASRTCTTGWTSTPCTATRRCRAWR